MYMAHCANRFICCKPYLTRNLLPPDAGASTPAAGASAAAAVEGAAAGLLEVPFLLVEAAPPLVLSGGRVSCCGADVLAGRGRLEVRLLLAAGVLAAAAALTCCSGRSELSSTIATATSGSTWLNLPFDRAVAAPLGV